MQGRCRRGSPGRNGRRIHIVHSKGHDWGENSDAGLWCWKKDEQNQCDGPAGGLEKRKRQSQRGADQTLQGFGRGEKAEMKMEEY